jgi:hypothetical protein
MPWQQLVADVGSEMIPADEQTVEMFEARGVDASGMLVPAYREVIVTIMRQSGKTTLLLPVEVEVMWEPMKTVAYTAQTGLDGRQKFTEDQRPILESSPVDQKVRQYYKAADNTGMWFRNGSRLKVLNTGQSAGHGKTLDLAVLDETWADLDDSREQALRPAMVTKPQAQFWNISTAGTAASSFLMRKVELGRAAVNAGRREGIAYFEWTIPDGEDIYDPGVWARYMPAFGITQSERLLRGEADGMKEGEFRRAYGNQWTDAEERLIPAEFWRRVVDPSGSVGDGFWFAVDAKPDRSRSVVVVGGPSGRVELAEVRPDVSWLVSWLVERGRPVVLASHGPLANVADELELAGLRVDRVDSLGVRKACGSFYDAVMDGQVSVGQADLVEEAVRHAARRSSADSWAWHREVPGGEILMALSLAFAVSVSDPLDNIW